MPRPPETEWQVCGSAGRWTGLETCREARLSDGASHVPLCAGEAEGALAV